MVRLLSLAEAAERMGITVKTLKKRIQEPGLQLPRPGRSFQITEHDFDLLVESTRCRCNSSPQAQGTLDPTKKTDISSQKDASTAECVNSIPIRKTSRPHSALRESLKRQSRLARQASMQSVP
jgi:excisionase family DNA binding protein